jgi:hypothetical protein
MKLSTGGHALDRAKRHQKRAIFSKTDYLGNQGLGPAARNLNPSANRQARQTAPHLNQQAIDRGHPAIDLKRINPLDNRDQAFHGNS